MKVTDKRMFTSEGELREEFRHLSNREAGEAGETGAGSGSGLAGSDPPPPEPPRPETGAPPAPEAQEAPPRVEMPTTPPEMGGPSFMDLVGLLAEPVAIYLGDVELPDGGTAENLEVARFHIDLLDVLRQKTAGNLSAREASVLEDVLYRLRLRYVQKRG